MKRITRANPQRPRAVAKAIRPDASGTTGAVVLATASFVIIALTSLILRALL